MADEIQVYDHPVLSDRARRLLTVVAAVAALLLGLVSPAHAADGHITGTVTGEGTGPLGDVWVEAYDADNLDYVDGDQTDAQGKYDILLPPGSYLVVFYAFDDDYEPELYDDVHDFAIEDATLVVVTGGTGTQADAELSRTSSISGHLTMNAADQDAVQVYDEEGHVAGWGFVEADGTYEVRGLRSGSYRLAFNRLSGFAYSAAEFYDDRAEGEGLAAGDVVTLSGGQARTGVDAVLSEGGHVTGTLQDSDGNPIRCRLQAFTSDQQLVTRSGWSDPTTGAFDITGLSTGSYLVRAVDGKGCQNGVQYLDGAGGPLNPLSSAADPVSVTLGGATALASALVYDLGPQPTNVVAPSVAGVPTVGTLLSADHGSWSPPGHLRYHYQWLAGGGVLPGATRRTYRPTQADLGQQLAVRVTVSRGAARTATATSAPTAPVGGGSLFNLAAPHVNGVVAVDSTLTVDPGSWSVPGATFTYVWSTGPKVLKQSSSPVFSPPDSIFKQPLTVTVWAAHAGYTPSSVTVLAASKVVAGTWPSIAAPRLKGRARIGSTLTVRAAKVQPAPRTLTFTWYRDGKVIDGASERRYTLTRSDVGHRIQVYVKYGRLHYDKAGVWSHKTRRVSR